MQIVRATQADVKPIVALNRQFHLDIPDFRWDTETWTTDQIDKGTFHLLKEGGSTYGAVCIQTALDNLPSTDAYIETIATREDLHGKGYGRELINQAALIARDEGKHRLIVESFLEYGLKDFYTKCGFQLESEQQDFHGHTYNVFTMEI